MVPTADFIRTRLATCRWLLWTLVAAFMLRALLPAGYMPDAQAMRSGTLVMTLCSADGSARNIVLSSPHSGDVPTESPSGHNAASMCAFAGLGLFTLTSPAPQMAYTQWTGLWLEPQTPFRQQVAQPIAGPPLGSRAPPARLA